MPNPAAINRLRQTNSTSNAGAWGQIGVSAISAVSNYASSYMAAKSAAHTQKINNERQAVAADLQMWFAAEEAAKVHRQVVAAELNVQAAAIQARAAKKVSQAVHGQVGGTAQLVLQQVDVDAIRKLNEVRREGAEAEARSQAQGASSRLQLSQSLDASVIQKPSVSLATTGLVSDVLQIGSTLKGA